MDGPKSVMTFARTLGNQSFNLVHYETNLNSHPDRKDDTSTPKDMALSLQKLTLSHALGKTQRVQLITWMRNNTTGNQSIRAGAPVGWTVADKTGSGNYGVANDIAILWSPTCKPIVLAIYTVRNKSCAKSRDDIIASITRLVFNSFKSNGCSLNS